MYNMVNINACSQHNQKHTSGEITHALVGGDIGDYNKSVHYRIELYRSFFSFAGAIKAIQYLRVIGTQRLIQIDDFVLPIQLILIG